MAGQGCRDDVGELLAIRHPLQLPAGGAALGERGLGIGEPVFRAPHGEA